MTAGVLIAGCALAPGCSGSGHRSPKAVRGTRADVTTTATATTSRSSAAATSITAAPAEPGTLAPGPPVPPVPPTNINPGAAWPPGTIVGDAAYRHLTGNIEFTPEAAALGTRVAYTVTLTNPTERWLFGPLTPPWAFSIYLYTPETEDSDLIPRIVYGVESTAPEFRHETPTGIQIGLLLAPHASYRFSGHAFTPAWWYESDFVVHADIIFTPVGVADAAAKIVRDAGSFTVLVPPTTTTTP